MRRHPRITGGRSVRPCLDAESQSRRDGFLSASCFSASDRESFDSLAGVDSRPDPCASSRITISQKRIRFLLNKWRSMSRHLGWIGNRHTTCLVRREYSNSGVTYSIAPCLLVSFNVEPTPPISELRILHLHKGQCLLDFRMMGLMCTMQPSMHPGPVRGSLNPPNPSGQDAHLPSPERYNLTIASSIFEQRPTGHDRIERIKSMLCARQLIEERATSACQRRKSSTCLSGQARKTHLALITSASCSATREATHTLFAD